jgi:hypothetical protein
MQKVEKDKARFRKMMEQAKEVMDAPQADLGKKITDKTAERVC